MSNETVFASRLETPDEKLVYEYVTKLLAKEPNEAVSSFFDYFYKGVVPLDRKYRDALKNVIGDPQSLLYFAFILNRAIHILWNRWNRRASDKSEKKALLNLLNRFEQLQDIPSRDEFIVTLRLKMRQFAETPQYRALQRRLRLWDNSNVANQKPHRVLGDDIRRHHFLYGATMLTDDLKREDREDILALQRREINRFREYLYEFFRHQTNPNKKPLPNKTGLETLVLTEAIEHFDPLNPESYQNESDDFRGQRVSMRTIGDFKKEFLRYLIKTLTVLDGSDELPNNRFVTQLERCIDMSAKGMDHLPYEPIVVTNICRRVLNFLIADTLEQANSRTLQELTQKEGYLKTVGLLLKIALFRKAITPWLEKRLGILFELYEWEEITEVQWLADTFEHLDVALSLNAKGVGYK